MLSRDAATLRMQQRRDGTPVPDRSTHGSLTRATGWVLQGRVLVAASALVTNVILTRALDPAALAQVYLCWSSMLLLSVVAAMGLPQALMRLLASALADGRAATANELLRAALWMSAAGALLMSIAQVLVLGPLQQWAFGLERSVLSDVLLGVWTGLTAMSLVVAEAHRGLHDVRRAARYGGALCGVLTAAMLAPLAMLAPDVRLWHVLALLCSASAVNLALALAALGRLREPGRAPRLQAGRQLRPLAVAAWPVLVGGSTFVAASQADLWIAGMLAPHEDVAAYGLAARVALLVALPLSVANGVLAPRVAHLHARADISSLQLLLRSTSSLTILVTLLLAVPIAIWAGPLLRVVFGESWTQAVPMLRLLLLAQLAIVVAGPAALLLAMSGNQVRVMHLTLFGTALLVCGAVVGGRLYGGVGIAAAAACAMLVQAGTTVLAARTRTGIWAVAGRSLSRRAMVGTPPGRGDGACLVQR